MSNVKFKARVTNYSEADEFLGDKSERQIGYKTIVRRNSDDNGILIIHHDTPIVTFYPGGWAVLWTGGIVSRTTANRLHYFTPDTVSVSSRITSDEAHYILTDRDGLTLNSDLTFPVALADDKLWLRARNRWMREMGGEA